MQSSWFAYESESEINVNFDGEPAMVKRFQVKARKRLLPERLGDSDLLSN